MAGGVSNIVSMSPPVDRKGLEEHLTTLIKHLGDDLLAVPDGAPEMLATKSRIEQVKAMLDRLNAHTLTRREWASFMISAGGLAIAALSFIFR